MLLLEQLSPRLRWVVSELQVVGPSVEPTAPDLEPDVPGLCIRVQRLIVSIDNRNPLGREARPSPGHPRWHPGPRSAAGEVV
jgi:hypothetical protein